MILHPGDVSLLLLFFLLTLFIFAVAVTLVPFIVYPLCPLLPPHVKIMIIPQVGNVVVVAFLILQNEPLDTPPLIIPPLCSAATAVLLATAVISIFLLLHLLILLVHEK